MIVAAADVAEEKGRPPYELQLAWQSKEYNALPRAGGLLDQPAKLMNWMSTLYSVWATFKEFQLSEFSPQWTLKHHDKYELIVKVSKLREELAQEDKDNDAVD